MAEIPMKDITKRDKQVSEVYNEDCLIGMNHIADGSIDMILCDLPYGNTNNKWDIVIPMDQLWKQYLRIIKDKGAIVLTAQQPFATDLINSCRKYFRYEIIWQKTQKGGFLNAKKMPLRAHENILVFYKNLPTYNPIMTQSKLSNGRVRGCVKGETSTNYCYHKDENYQYIDDGSRYPDSILCIPNWNGTLFGDTSKSAIHPTQKPIPLFAWLIKTYTNEGDLVLDNCMGSQSSRIAAFQEKRSFIGFELNKEYFDSGSKRFELSKQQQSLFI